MKTLANTLLPDFQAQLIVCMMESDFWLFVFVGIPTWALVDGTWSSLAQLADHLPEGYSISAYLILSLTVGNIFPLGIGYLMENSFSSQLLKVLILSILSLGFLSGIFMGIFYRSSVTIGRSEFSLPLCLLFFIVGACSSTSNVTHFTFVSQFSATNTTALGTGMGVGSMIAGLLGILQGTWLIEYGFTTTIYYITLSLLYLPAMFCFLQLEKRQPALSTNRMQEKERLIIANFAEESDPNIAEILPPLSHSVDRSAPMTLLPPSFSLIFIRHFSSILCLQAFNSSLGYGFVPALISYACGKFPNANTILLFATGTAAMVDPWTKYLTNYYRLTTFSQLLHASSILASLAGGLILCASLPDSSSFYQESLSFLPVVCYILCIGLFGYTNLCIFRYFKEQAVHDFSYLSSQVAEVNALEYENKQEQIDQMVQLAYRYCGIASQTGALIGSIFAFSLVVSNAL